MDIHDLPKDVILYLCTFLLPSSYYALKKTCTRLRIVCAQYIDNDLLKAKKTRGTSNDYDKFLMLSHQVSQKQFSGIKLNGWKKIYFFNNFQHGPCIYYYNMETINAIFFMNNGITGPYLHFMPSGRLNKFQWDKYYIYVHF
jgi:hypothetical protein